ncbi:MAG: SGNH/GDSL hydrolase family protein [Cyclobacteriaceae bacterium]
MSSFTYLALGDSYTIGEKVAENERWPVQLALKLGWQVPQIIATTGWTSQELLDALDQAKLKKHYDWVSLLIGVNDQYDGVPLHTYQENLTLLSERMLDIVSDRRHIFMLSIPDYSITPFVKEKGMDPVKVGKALELFNQANAEAAHHYGFQFCNVTPFSRTAEKDFSLLAEDQLHPSGKMYSAWVAQLLKDCDFS